MADNKNVYAAEPLATGTLFVAPLGTPGPTSAVSVLNPAYVDLGHVGEDGYTETRDVSTEKKKNFGGATVKVLRTDYTHTITFTLLESLNADVLKAVYGANNVTVTAATSTHGKQVTVQKTAQKLPHMSWVIDTTDSELNAFYRSFIPDGQIISQEPVVIVHTDTIEYSVELECFADESGVHVYTYTDDGQKTGSGS